MSASADYTLEMLRRLRRLNTSYVLPWQRDQPQTTQPFTQGGILHFFEPTGEPN